MTVRRGVGAYPGDLYYDPTRPSWLPYWIDSPSENAQKWGFYPSAPSNSLVYPDPVAPVPQVPAGALDYSPGGSSTSIPLNPVGTIPNWQSAAQQTMDAAAVVIAADEESKADASRKTLWVVAAAVVIGLVALRK